MWIFIIIGSLIVLYILAGFISMKCAIGRRKKPTDFLKKPLYAPYRDIVKKGEVWARESKYDDVWITSHDNLKLHGAYYNNNSNVTLILFHGYRSTPICDFSGICEKYYKQGYNLLLVDHRAHGLSEGKYLGFGVLERFDCLKWCEYIASITPDTKIILGGMSMGASTILMASDLNLPKQVVGIVSDCGFSSPLEIVTIVIKKMHIIPFLLVPLMNIMTKIFAKYSYTDASTIDSIVKSTIPVLLVHGTGDDFVPYQMSVAAYEARPDKTELVLIDNAPHGISYLIDMEKCEKHLFAFVEKVIKEDN